MLCAFTPCLSFSQYSSGDYRADVFPTYLVFLEAGGHGFLASINYEDYLSRRVGIGVGYGIYVPVMVNFYFGNKYLLELGAGGMYSPYKIPEPFIEREKQLLLGCTLGHKFQPNEGGLTLRYSFTPMLNPSNGRFLPMFGLSIGLAVQ
jgi:hypothetical protein